MVKWFPKPRIIAQCIKIPSCTFRIMNIHLPVDGWQVTTVKTIKKTLNKAAPVINTVPTRNTSKQTDSEMMTC